MKKYDFVEKGIHRYLSGFIRSLGDINGKIVVDIPAGTGRASYLFAKQGANVIPLDLFPTFFSIEELKCRKADMADSLPVEDNKADIVVCQEGIEHVSDPLRLMREFNRILKPGGLLIITTPSMSHFRARVSHMLFETDDSRKMPPCEIDEIWFASQEAKEFYLGHLFLLTANQLRNLSVLSGFKIKQRIPTKISPSSVALGLFLYPVVYVMCLVALLRTRLRFKTVQNPMKGSILNQIFEIQTSPATLFCKHLFWTFEKRLELQEVNDQLKSMSRKHG